MRPDLRVVIVDDDPHIRELVRRMLGTIDVDVAADLDSGEDAVAWFADNDADVVVMDIQMPGMGGVEATRRIKASHPDVTIFGFTGWGRADADELLAAGAADVFEKTKLRDLMDAVQAL